MEGIEFNSTLNCFIENAVTTNSDYSRNGITMSLRTISKELKSLTLFILYFETKILLLFIQD